MKNNTLDSGEDIQHILICGGGLAAWMSACALRSALPTRVRISLVEIEGSENQDIFYGTVSPPTSYNLNLAWGVSEPELLLKTATSFSYGTQYENWGPSGLSWIQCHHLPFSVYDGIPFTNIVFRHGDKKLDPYLASAKAAEMGRFIHPPNDASNPLSRSEYGYQFCPTEWRNTFRQTALNTGIIHIKTETIRSNRNEDIIIDLELADGTRLSADFYVDCSGQNSVITESQHEQKDSVRLGAQLSDKSAVNLGPPMRRVKATQNGWTSETYLKDRVLYLTLFDKDDVDEMNEAVYISTGRNARAWSGNCVALGHAAAVIEPLTPAPIILLQRDIERLLTLIPLSSDMSLEASAYNQAFEDDYQHALIFNQAFFTMPQSTGDAYWTRRQSSEMPKKLARKLNQFESRGLHVGYDLEMFNAQDWAILNFGMQRMPERVDVFARLQDQSQIDQQLEGIHQALMRTVEKMPPHHIYMDKLLSYLKRKQGSHV